MSEVAPVTLHASSHSAAFPRPGRSGTAAGHSSAASVSAPGHGRRPRAGPGRSRFPPTGPRTPAGHRGRPVVREPIFQVRRAAKVVAGVAVTPLEVQQVNGRRSGHDVPLVVRLVLARAPGDSTR